MNVKLLLAFSVLPLCASGGNTTHWVTLKDSSPTVRIRIYDDCGNRYLYLEAYGDNWFNKTRFMEQFFNGDYQTYYPYHEFSSMYWTDISIQRSHPFAFDQEELNKGIKSHFSSSSRPYVQGMDINVGNYFDVWAKMHYVSKEYSINYIDVPVEIDISRFPTYYTYDTNENELLNASKLFSQNGKELIWEDINTHERMLTLPTHNPHNLTLRPLFTPYVASIKYANCEGLANYNPSTYSYQLDNIIPLKDPITPEGVTFDGWYLEGNKISYLSEDLTKDKSSELVLNAKFLSGNDKKISFYNGSNKMTTVNYEFNNRNEILNSNLPSIDGVTTRWDIPYITEYKDYNVNLIKDNKNATVFIYNEEHSMLHHIEVEQGTSFTELTGLRYGLSYFYDFSPRSESDSISIKNNKIYGDVSLNAKVGKVKVISNYLDYLDIKNDLSGYYLLNNDINFKGAVVNPITNFKGVFDGNGYKLRNFKLINKYTSKDFALFENNNGFIKDVTIENFVADTQINYAENVTTKQGLLCGTNNGVISNISINNSDSTIYMGLTQTSYKYEGNVRSGLIAATNTGLIKNISISNISLTSYNVVGYGTPDMSGFMNYRGTLRANAAMVVGDNQGTIRNINIDQTATYNSQFASRVNEYLAQGGVTFELNAGIVAGKNSGTITDIYNNGIFNQHGASKLFYDDDYLDISVIIGGTVGQNAGKIDRVNSNTTINLGDISASYAPGGVVGTNQASSYLSHTLSQDKLFVIASGTLAGGVIGVNRGYVHSTAARGVVNASGDSRSVSGFVYRNDGVIMSCYAASNIYIHDTESTFTVGTFVNIATAFGDVLYCFSSTLVRGNGHIGTLYHFNNTALQVSTNVYVNSDAENDSLDALYSESSYTNANQDQLTNKGFLNNIRFYDFDWSFVDGNFPLPIIETSK